MRDGEQNAVKRAVLEFMRDRATPEKHESRLEASRDTRESRRVPAFSDLEQHKQLRAHLAAGQFLGIRNPFHRAHGGMAGATSEIDGRIFSNFASYDYLGLNGNREVLAAAIEAVARYGISSSASRLVAGERPVHSALESNIADFYGVDAAITMVSGYLTNVTTISCLVGSPDLILHDELAHNSVLAGAQLSGATRRSFKHNDLEDLERQLTMLGSRHRRALVIVEGLYSMDGDIADLPRLLSLRARYGFWLMVDEAHTLGVLGATGRGLAEHWNCNPRDVDIWMGTLSKTTASCGGYIAGSSELVELLKAYAGGFVYSVGLSPVLAATASCALDVMRREPSRVMRLQANGRSFLHHAHRSGLETGLSGGHAVTPVIVGDSVRAIQLSNELIDDGINVLPIIFPAVPEGSARLRFFITSEHSSEQLEMAAVSTARRIASLLERNVGVSSIDQALVARHMTVGPRNA